MLLLNDIKATGAHGDGEEDEENRKMTEMRR
jgi:hypothetical protein